MEKSNIKQNYLIIIVGPTAIGKTALSIELAKHFGSNVVSCDSRQFFKEMTIGTAVPSQEELVQVKHHFIENKSIHENYNVGDYEKEVLPLLDRLFQQNNIQVVIGCSQLYVDAVMKGLDDFPEVLNAIKDEIEDIYDEKGIEGLQENLSESHSEYVRFIK